MSFKFQIIHLNKITEIHLAVCRRAKVREETPSMVV